MKKCITIICFLMFLISCNKHQQEACTHLELVKKYANGDSVDGLLLENAIINLENLTGITSEFDGSTIGAIYSTSKSTTLKWEKSLKQKGIYCNDQNESRSNLILIPFGISLILYVFGFFKFLLLRNKDYTYQSSNEKKLINLSLLFFLIGVILFVLSPF